MPKTLRARRQEILRWFEENVYGFPPAGLKSSVSWEVVDAPDEGIHAEIGIFTVTAGGGRGMEIPVKFFRPDVAGGRFPATIFINNREREELEYRVDAEFWPVVDIVKAGWIAVGFNTKDSSHDMPLEWEKDGGIVGLDESPSGASRGKALSAWAWLASEIRRHLCEREDVEAGRIALIGHSRGGKAALLAAARDEGFSLAYSNSSGCGGAGHHASRGEKAEKIVNITTRFPNWFCDRFSEFSGKDTELKYDQHHLLGCIAPRRVYVSSSADDAWADPESEYRSCQLATPIYEFAGLDGMVGADLPFPGINEKRHGGSIGYHLREGKHNLNRVDWEWFLEFAEA